MRSRNNQNNYYNEMSIYTSPIVIVQHEGAFSNLSILSTINRWMDICNFFFNFMTKTSHFK